MLYFSKIRIITVILFTIIFSYFALSNFTKLDDNFFSKNINLGLDLQGGSYLLLEIDNKPVINQKLQAKIIQLELDPHKLLFIPKGLAHGFFSLEEGTILNYKCDKFFNSKYESGFNLLDSDINVDFKIRKEDILISEKDKDLPVFDKSYIYEEL